MPYYFVAQIEIEDRNEYSIYESGFLEIFQKYKGKMLAVDEDPKLYEGTWPYTRTVLVEFPSEIDANNWYKSEDYTELAKHRKKASNGNLILIKGLE